MPEGMGANWQRRAVAEHLLSKAGDLVEFWSEDPDRAEIDSEFARECIARWLSRLPGTAWDLRLGDPPGD